MTTTVPCNVPLPTDATARASRLVLPREHGAWAMLLLPFVSALLLARRLTWEVLPAAVVVVGLFVIREPQVALWRQARVWKERRAEAEQARRSLVWYVPPILVSGLLLLWRLPFWILLAMGMATALLTLASVYLAVENRRRSLLLQLASAAGLSGSALMAWLAARANWGAAIWWLWGLQFAHSSGALLAVHTRLQTRIASRNGGESAGVKLSATAAQVLLLLGAAGCAATGRLGIALALAFSAGVHVADLARLRDPAFLQTPLRRVGWRELGISVVFSALLLAGLW